MSAHRARLAVLAFSLVAGAGLMASVSLFAAAPGQGRPRLASNTADRQKAATALSASETPVAASSELTVRITSPLGRIGTPETIRIVAQVRAGATATVQPLRFFVDGVLVGTAETGPPYAVPWVDENPFMRHEIAVQASDSDGRTAEDKIVLEPYEIMELAQVNSVLVEASVYDKKGHYVRDLDASRFALLEDGAPQTIDLVQQESIPATFTLLVDSSQSMSRRMPFVRDAAARVVSYLKPQDRVVVVPFGTELGAVTGPTDDRETVSEAIGSIQAGGRTAIHDALVAMAKQVREISGRKALVLITDGYDERSKSSAQEALDAMKAAETTVYVIGIGGVSGISLRGERFMRDLAGATGGRAFFPPTEQALAEVYDTIAADAQNRYLITYTPVNQKADGRWRAITLKAADYDHLVQSRTGYQAPTPPPIRPSIEFAVTDLQQRYVDITRDDLVVLENGVEQKIETFQEAVSPVSIVLALDASGSMKKSAEAVKAAARAFVHAIRPEDRLSVIVFGDKSTLAHAFATNREWSLEAIDQYKPSGGTALYDALWDAFQYVNYVKTATGRGVVVVLTDGRDEDYDGKAAGSVHTYDEIVNLMREAEATTFPIGLGTKIDSGRLKQLAQLSGGAAYFPLDVGTLDGEYAKIIENLRRRFVLSFTSSHTERDGSWRTLEIRSRRKDLVVSARSGYFAPDR